MLQLQSDKLNLHEGDDYHQCGRPVTSPDKETIEKVSKLVMTERRLSVGFVAASVVISTGRVHLILSENLYCTIGAANVIGR